MPEFPRTHKDFYVDNGNEVAKGQKCPNCGSSKYRQTISTESCSSCGLGFNYWHSEANPSGGNAVYEAYTKRVERERDDAEWRREQEWQREQEREYESCHYSDDEEG